MNGKYCTWQVQWINVKLLVMKNKAAGYFKLRQIGKSWCTEGPGCPCTSVTSKLVQKAIKIAKGTLGLITRGFRVQGFGPKDPSALRGPFDQTYFPHFIRPSNVPLLTLARIKGRLPFLVWLKNPIPLLFLLHHMANFTQSLLEIGPL